MTHLSKQAAVDALQHMDAHVYARDFPAHEITLRFRNEADKLKFLGGILDGWGEGYVDLDWNWNGQPDHYAGHYKVFDVTLIEEEYESEEEYQQRMSDLERG